MCWALYRSPCTPSRTASEFRSAISSADSPTWVAAAFSATRLRRRVPGIGTIHGCWASSHASATCPGVASLDRAICWTCWTRARLAARLSSSNRGIVARMSPSVNAVPRDDLGVPAQHEHRSGGQVVEHALQRCVHALPLGAARAVGELAGDLEQVAAVVVAQAHHPSQIRQDRSRRGQASLLQTRVVLRADRRHPRDLRPAQARDPACGAGREAEVLGVQLGPARSQESSELSPPRIDRHARAPGPACAERDGRRRGGAGTASSRLRRPAGSSRSRAGRPGDRTVTS